MNSRKYSAILFLILTLFLPSLSQAKENSATCIQTFNAYGPWYAPNLNERTKKLGEYLDDNPCDILLLQEVWLSAHKEQLKEILIDQGFNVFHFDNIGLSGRIFGLMTAVKGSIEGQGFFEFDENYKGFMDYIRKSFYVAKGVGLLKVKLPQLDKSLFIVNTHLHHSDINIRASQVAQLLLNVEELNQEGLSVIMGGDFNLEPFSESYKTIATRFVSQSPKTMCTYCEKNPLAWGFDDKDIDHIFVSSDLIPSVLSEEIGPKKWQGSYLSDHYGVRLYLRL